MSKTGLQDRSLFKNKMFIQGSEGWEFAHLISERIAHRSWSLICLERPERFAHGRSFPLSDLSDSLTVAHLS